jgi:hypothetical protein
MSTERVERWDEKVKSIANRKMKNCGMARFYFLLPPVSEMWRLGKAW